MGLEPSPFAPPRYFGERDGSLPYFLTNASTAAMEVMTARRRSGSKLLSRSEGANKVSSSQQFDMVIASSVGYKISRKDENEICFGNLTREKDRAFPSSNEHIDDESAEFLLSK